RPGLGVDLDALQPREVEDDAIIDGPQPGAVVGAAADRQRQGVGGGEGHVLRRGIGTGTGGDQSGTPVDHRVVDGAGVLVAGVLGGGQPSPEAGYLTWRGAGPRRPL